MLEIPANSRVLSDVSAHRFEGGGLSEYQSATKCCSGMLRMRGSTDAAGRKRKRQSRGGEEESGRSPSRIGTDAVNIR